MGCLVCGKKAYFGILKPKGEKQTSTHCKEHKGENMVDVYIPRCDSEGCMKRCSFGIEGETAMRCKDHKEHNMVYMLSRRCDIQGCVKQPSFGFEGMKKTRCKDHMKDGMIDVTSRRCSYEGCRKQPSYGIVGEKATHCKEHAEKEMVDVRNSRCHFEGCLKRPSYGVVGEMAARCKDHAEKGMVNVVSRRCDSGGCAKQPTFGILGQSATRCKEHVTKGMVDVGNRQCDFEGCVKRPTFGTPGLKPSRCGTHESEDMEDITNARCQQCGEVHVNRGTPYCSGCFLGEGSRFRSAHEKSAFQILERLQCSQEIRAVGVNVGVKGVLKVDGNGRHTKGLELDLPIILKDGRLVSGFVLNVSTKRLGIHLCSLGAIELDGYEHFQPVLRKGKEWDEAETYYRNKVLADLAKDRYLLGNRVRVARIALRKQAHDHLAFERRVKNAVKALDAGESFFVAEEDKPAYSVLLERYDAIDDAPEIPASLRALRSSCTLDDALLVPIKGQPKLRKDFTGAEIAKKRTRHAKDQHSMDQFVTAEKDETKRCVINARLILDQVLDIGLPFQLQRKERRLRRGFGARTRAQRCQETKDVG